MKMLRKFAMRIWIEQDRIRKGEDGQDLIEYALLIVLIVLAAISVFPPLASAIKGVFSNATNALTTPPA